MAITGGKPGMELIQDLVWEHVLPAISTTAHPENSQAEQALKTKLINLTIPTVKGQSHSPMARQTSKQIFDLNSQGEKRLWFDFGDGGFSAIFKSISFDFSPNGCTCTIRDDRNIHTVVCGHAYWHRNVTTVSSQDGQSEQPVAASGAWLADYIYEMQWCFVETASRSTLTCHFVEDTIKIDWEENATFADQKHPQLRGQAVPNNDTITILYGCARGGA